jgi:drug/metabolite transporter (DMT)-like permease
LETSSDRPAGKILIAFAIIYFVWGSTFYAIRIGVHEVPPLLFAAMRFFTAGAVMYGWLMARGGRSPTARQWVAASFLGLLIFVGDYGLLFWAEKRVPSGIAAVVLATIPVFIALCEIVLLRTQRLTVRLAVALLIGIAGVAVLVSHSFKLGDVPIDTLGAVALILAAFSWSISTVLTKRLPLPESKPMSSAAQMLSGGIMLVFASAIAGDFRGFNPSAVSPGAWFALVYLIVFGSIIGFTAYIWLLHHESPTKVGTYAYVNPVVAVLVGYFLGGEALGPRTVLGTLCVLVSVVLITRAGAKKPVVIPPVKEAR